ncbi:protein DpdJ [Polyangium sp. 6x1]|uniref:protein DpdJ n=1 Tax=Polyangium sp. 6x1 TaxID=3042689 RepID=UPI002482670D|nr:protein DpdJ [Polyangium sp. 6x1]MDI1450821.1 protein DpdJ [Polyangium sp. 6x1]
MSQVQLPSALAVALLDRLEREEQRLLCWGYVDGAFDKHELEDHAGAVIAKNANGGDPAELIKELLRFKWLFRVPNERRYRTRSAETIRLLSKLRQIRVYPSTRPADVGGLWRSAPPLVADYRFLAPPRTFPRRDITVAAAESMLRMQSAPLERAILHAFTSAGSRGERKLSGFQVRATERILAERADAGTVVCSGTGSGKTLAFYLPAFITLAPLLDDDAWTKCVAIYPRNELLKDQLREAIAAARRIAPALRKSGRRGLTFGALFGEVKNDADHVAAPKWGWPEQTFGGKRGRTCPFLRCPDCNAPLFWADEDRRRRDPSERLRCSSPDCDVTLGPEIVRLTRASLCASPPDILLVSTEMLNRNMSASDYAKPFGIGLSAARRPRLLLLDEVHTYEGTTGAHVALLLRRWKFLSKARPHVVGLSATLEDAARFFADLTGLRPGSVAEVSPLASEFEAEGADYQVALRGDPSWGTSLLSTTIQTLMLMRRVLAPREEPLSLAGRRVFAFTDRLDGINRLLENARDAEGRYPDSNHPRPRGTVLAGLRRVDAPDHDARYADGQAWDLAVDLGHRLELNPTRANSLIIGRTTAQDKGVDPNADVVVATASLEVGYDDPSVGAVVQHKAPKSAAAFLQRKGRAGRFRTQRTDGTSISMRPWTVVVLSDFGRDRVVYQDYEHIFSPTLKPRHLPTNNRALLRMQATYALFDFLGFEAQKAGLSPEPWIDLASPCERGSRGDERRARQRFYEMCLRQLLESDDARHAFARFLQGALAISEDEVQALLWEPPRSVMLEAVPTLLRRLATSWKRAFETSLEPTERWGPPLPEFVQRSLFTKLLVPEVKLLVPKGDGRPRSDDENDEPEVDEHGMVLAEALREFAPGRVSKRFDLEGDVSHWIDPGEGATLSIDSFSTRDDRIPVGRFSYSEQGVTSEVDVYRPVALRVSAPPQTILPTSNARPCWRSQLVAPTPGHWVELPQGSLLAPLVAGMTFHTHHLGSPVEIRRFVVGADVVTAYRNGKRGPERRVDLVDENGANAAVGWASEVDAVAIKFTVPRDLLSWVKESPALVRSLRPLCLRALVRGDASLNGLADGFQRDALVDAFLAAVLLAFDAAPGATLASVSQSIEPECVARTVALVSDGDDDDASEGTVPRRVKELKMLVENPIVFTSLRTHGEALWREIDETWFPWLQSIFKATLGASFRDAITALCPQVDEEDLVVEGPGVHPGEDDTVWVTESAIGGSGALEAFYSAYAKDPRQFSRLWHGCLEPSDSERVAASIEQILDALGGAAPSARLVAAVARVRDAMNHAEALQAVQQLRETLTLLGLYVEHATLTILFARVLRPGSSPDLDVYLAETLARWRDLEEHAGIVVEARTFALVRSHHGGLAEFLTTSPSTDEGDRQRWTYATLLGLLWRRPSSIRRESLDFGNPFIDAPICDRLMVPLSGDVSPIVRVDSASWFDELTDALNRNGVARLVATHEQKERLADAVRHLATHPIDTGALHVFARLAGYARDMAGAALTIEMPEALQ